MKHSLLALSLALCSTPALAQIDNLPDHLPNITYDSPCGAPGVGRNARTGVVVTYDPPDTGFSQRVGVDGTWISCSFPPPPLTCKSIKLMPWNDSKPGTVGRNFCFPTSSHLPARKAGVSATVVGTPPGVSSDQRGAQQWSCTPAGWRLVSSYCK